MRIIKREIVESDVHSGSVKMELDDDDDMYHLHCLLEVGDTVFSKTMRMVNVESGGGTVKKKMFINIGIKIEKIEYEPEANTMRLNGKTVTQSEYVRMGQYHTTEIMKGLSLTLSKDVWDSLRLEIIDELRNPMASAEIAAVAMQEGLAHVCLVRKTMTKTVAVIQRSMPKKRPGMAQANFEKALVKFFSDTYEAICNRIDLNTVKYVLIGSPGFVAEEFLAYLRTRFVREDCRPLVEHGHKISIVHCSSGHKHAVDEMLVDPAVLSLLGDVAAVEEGRVFTAFERTLMDDPDRACYGLLGVAYAAECGFIGELLITDGLLQKSDFKTRDKLATVLAQVREFGGKVIKFSSMHGTGERLDGLTGIAAILRVPVQDIDELAKAG